MSCCGELAIGDNVCKNESLGRLGCAIVLDDEFVDEDDDDDDCNDEH